MKKMLTLTSFQLAILRFVMDEPGLITGNVRIGHHPTSGVYAAIRRLISLRLMRRDEIGSLYITPPGERAYNSHLRLMGITE